MKFESVWLAFRRCALSLTIFLFLFVSSIVLAKDPSAQKTIRVAVKTNVPLTQEIVDELSQYGKVNCRLIKLNVLDMQVPTQNLSSLSANPLVQYVEQDQQGHPAGQGLSPVLVDDIMFGVSVWSLDTTNITDSVLNVPFLPPNPIWPGIDTRVVNFDGSGVYVAVLDSGLVQNWRDYFPEVSIAQDLATAFTGGPAGPGETNNDNGTFAVTDRLWEKDTNGHGTAVTSVILGYSVSEYSKLFGDPQLPPLPIHGVAPKVKIIPVKIGGNGSEHNSNSGVLTVAAGFDYVVGLTERPMIINLSWGFFSPSQILKDAIDLAIANGIIVMATAGNNGPNGRMDWPGAFPEVISTGQTGWLGEWTETGIEGGPATSSGTWITLDVPEEGSASSESFIFLESSRAIGPSDPDDPFYQQLDVVAPGAAIYQPNASRGASSPDSFNSYRGHPLNFLFGYGTSLASPHVAGIAALMMQKNRAMGNPDLTQAQVEAILKCSAIPVVKGTHTDPLFSDRVSEWGDNCVDPDPSDSGVCREEQGYGLVQADRALDCIGSGGELSCVVSIDPLECASP